MKIYKYLFGPLMSRRFARSLGIDLCPMKTCSYDCIFCQLGRTPVTTTKREEFFPLDEICAEIGDWLAADGQAQYITLAGSGEPTLYARFGELIDFIHAKTDIPVLLLSNGSLFGQAEVRAAAAKADVVKLSMSVWNQALFEQINRPVKGMTFSSMIDGEIIFRQQYSGKLILEVFLLEGINAMQDDVEKIAQFARQVKPDLVHFNTVTRPPAENFACSVDRKKLEDFAGMFMPRAEIPAEVAGTLLLNKNIDEDKILALIERRPVTLQQLAETFGVHPNEIAKVTGKFLRENKIIMKNEHEQHYFKGNKI